MVQCAIRRAHTILLYRTNIVHTLYVIHTMYPITIYIWSRIEFVIRSNLNIVTMCSKTIKLSHLVWRRESQTYSTLTLF